MGKLLQLELFNFKSYKGHHVLQFGDSYFTSIIGPNGSGKSNSMDAISFVLGIKSSHLRSTHLKDLVYRGRVLKHSKINADGTATDLVNGANGNANGSAEPDILYEDAAPQISSQRNDPQTAWVMAVYEDEAGEEQRWKRSITSSGTSEYRINNRVVTAKQYNDTLEEQNILIKARNFLVFQGDVEAIASQSPADLTRLIEQISGSLEYKKEYEKLKMEKEKADEDQHRRTQQRRGINGEVRHFEEQKKELDRFEELRKERASNTAAHILWKLYHLQRTIEDGAAEIQKHQEELKELRRSVKKSEEKHEQSKTNQAKVARDMHKYEREVKKREKAVEEKENELIPINEKLSITSGKVKANEKRVGDIAVERDSQQRELDSLQKNVATVQKAQERWQEDWRKKQEQTGRELNENDRREYQRLRGEVSKQTGDDQIQKDNIERQIKADDGTVASLKSKLNSTQTQVDSLESEVADLSARHAEFRNTVKTTAKSVGEKKRQVNEKTSERERARLKHIELEEKLQEVLRRLKEHDGLQMETQREAKNREIVAKLRHHFPGIKGMVNTLCTPKQKKYETAIATVLGKYWDAVIVDSAKTAQDCVQHCKQYSLGYLTFLPLDTVVRKQANANMRGMLQGVRLAFDTIDYDPSIERAVSFACGNAVVTDTLDLARELCYTRGVQVKAVTLDGTVIHKGGNMTGGEDPTDRKRRFGDTNVEHLRGLEQKLRADIESLPRGHKNQAEEEQLLAELTGLEAKLNHAQDEMKALERNIDSKKRELGFAKSQLADLKPKYEQEAQGLEELRQTLEGHTSSIAAVEDQLFGPFCKRLGYENIREYEDQQMAALEEATGKEGEFKAQLSRLENQLKFQTQQIQTTKNRIAALQAANARDVASIAQLEQQKETVGSELDVINAGIEQLNEQLETLRSEHEEHGKLVGQARKDVQKRSDAVEKARSGISEQETLVHTASAKRRAILLTCKLDSVKIPLERGSRPIDSVPMQEGDTDEGEDDPMDIDGEEQPSGPRVTDYGILPDFDQLDEELQEDDSAACDARLQDEIHTITAELEKMAPNMRSADKLQATRERLQATDREFQEAKAAASEAGRIFAKVRDTRKALFNRAFTHINDRIGTVYRDLTKTKTFPLGGSASLDIEHEDEPYLSGIKYHAMPPLKRFRDMELLSGGEKTMAALALLFAVHTFAPSPFFVLDEVDAALDNANTAQLANYVRENAGPGMQFVVISLKTGLFQNSETLVGVMRDQGVNSSKALTLDLRKYQAVA